MTPVLPPPLRLQILDLDGSLLEQTGLCAQYRPHIHPARTWGPRLRLACSFRRFRRFAQTLAWDPAPTLTCYGSGDFHHVSLALVRRLTAPFNLLVLDKHPDWMRGVPLLHCGTWLYHAARLPLVQRVFHVGGDLDFDNAFRWLAPWPLLHSGKIVVFPAVRRFQRGRWKSVPNEPMRPDAAPVSKERLAELLRPYRDDLTSWPLYVSLDKDVMTQADAVVNWDSGHLTLADVRTVLTVFLDAAGGRLAGMDIVGDWSPVRVQGWLRSALHATEHPALTVDLAEAVRRNERANRALLEQLGVTAD